jgi:hypothetical protein
MIAGDSYRNFLRSTKVGVRFSVRRGHRTRKPLMPMHLGMEPVAGFGHFSTRLRLKHAPFSLVNQV